MAAYRDRIKADLDRWIGAGLVAADKRAAILATIPESRRLDAATALAWVGGVLLGVAIIAFVAANWDVLPKLARFAVLLTTFLGLAAGGAWAAHKQRPLLCDIALMLATLVFAASIGLTGQIFDIVGDPRTAFYMAGAAGFALALAGRSTGAAIAGLIFIALGDFTEREWFSGLDSEAPWMLVAAPVGAFLALRWSSAPLSHVSALGVIYCFGWFAARTDAEGGIFLFLSIAMAAMAAGARWLHGQGRAFASVFYGWFACAALVFFAIAGYLPWFGDESSQSAGIAHRLVWLAASGALIALGLGLFTGLAPALGAYRMSIIDALGRR